MNNEIYDKMEIKNNDSEDIHKIKARLIELFEIVDNHQNSSHYKSLGGHHLRKFAVDAMLSFFNFTATILRS